MMALRFLFIVPKNLKIYIREKNIIYPEILIMSSNPKRADKIKYYKPETAEEEAGGDFFQLLSFISGFVSIMFKV